jgi:hypothetical protein
MLKGGKNDKLTKVKKLCMKKKKKKKKKIKKTLYVIEICQENERSGKQ